MAVVKKGMIRPNVSDIFDVDIIENIERKVTSADEVRVSGQFPVDVYAIAKDNNINIIEKNLNDDISGMLINEDGLYTIYVESRHHSNRKRFTIAHELAHFFLHRKLEKVFADKVFFRGGVLDNLEYQANSFASDLLMPKSKFLSLVKEGRDTIEDLANFFEVSTLAVRVRAKQLGLKGHGL